MRTIYTLTEEEKRDAELYHDFVYEFLRSNNYDIENFYDIVIMGFIRAIQTYHRKEDAKKYRLKTLCKRYMNDEMMDYFRYINRQKRNPDGGFTSLDMQFEDNKETFINTIITPTLEDEFFEEYDKQEETDRIKDILSTLTPLQREIAILRASGKPNSYILKKLHISPKQLSVELKKMRGELPNEEQTQPKRTVDNINDYIGVPTEVLLTLKLSARQLSVLNLLMVGYKESDIGRELGLQRQAVYDAVKKIRIKASKVR